MDVLVVFDEKVLLYVEQLLSEVLLKMRERRLENARCLRACVLQYVSSCGSWKRAFPSSLNGDVYVPFHFNFESKADYWIEENFRFWFPTRVIVDHLLNKHNTVSNSEIAAGMREQRRRHR